MKKTHDAKKPGTSQLISPKGSDRSWLGIIWDRLIYLALGELLIVSAGMLFWEFQVYAHENVHAANCAHFGGTPTVVYNRILPPLPVYYNAVTYCADVPAGNYTLLKFLDAQNELNYNFIALVPAIFGALGIGFGLFMGWKILEGW